MPAESKTPDALALVAGAVEASNRRDFDSMFRIFAPGAVYDLSPLGLGAYEGLAAIRALFEEWWRGYDELETEVHEALDLHHGVVFVRIVQSGRPVGSTAVVRAQQGWAMTVVGGMVVRVTAYLDPDDARAAAKRLAQERADG